MTNALTLDQLEIEQLYTMVDTSAESISVVYLGRSGDKRLVFKVAVKDNFNRSSNYELALLPRDLSQTHFFRAN